VELKTHPHLKPRFKKEYKYTSTAPLGLNGELPTVGIYRAERRHYTG
jgi:hypothetical protein